MNHNASSKSRLYLLFFLLVLLTCSPVWAFEYFTNQDGSAHVYSSHLMFEILKGNPAVNGVYALNSFSVPNSTGHWLMVLLVPFFSPFVITKIMVTLTFVGLAAAIVWLRFQIAGEEDFASSILIGFALSFNWLWMLGSYNFMIGVIVFVFTVGLFFRWRERLNLKKCLLLSLLLVLAFLSHIISFLILAGTLSALAVFTEKPRLKRAVIWTLLAFLPVIPLIFLYKILSQSGEPFHPAWRNLTDPYSLSSWLVQLAGPDPFVLLSRKTLPFVRIDSKFFAVFAPILWIGAGFALLTAATLANRRFRELRSAKFLPFVLLFVFSMLAAIFAPDDFGLTNGSVLRERILLCGLIFFVPLFRAGNQSRLKFAAHACLIFVIVFQTAVMWEYALQSDRDAREFMAAQSAIAPNDALASVIIVEQTLRFHSVSLPQLGNYFGFTENVLVWDNYEIGHYLFPIVGKTPAEKQFAFALTTSNVFPLDNPRENFDENLTDLEKCLAANHQRIDKLTLWGKNPRIEAVLSQWFETQPVFENERIRVFRHR